MQFWADVLLEEPENAKLLPPSASQSFGAMSQIIPLMSKQKS
jgi:hypothetical protein